MKIGIIIGRMQPVHLGHMQLINKSLKNNNLTLIILGSSGLSDSKNIFTDTERKQFLKMTIEGKSKYKILSIKDTQTNKEWVQNLSELLKKTIQDYFQILIDINRKDIIFYCGDVKNDYAIQAISQHKKVLFTDNVSISEFSRDILAVNHWGRKLTLSSTLVRDALYRGDYKLLERLLPSEVFKEISGYYGK